MTTFYLVRHGETAANAAHKKQGQLNTPETYLTAKGIRQAQRLQQAFDLSHCQRVIASPLQRAQETATLLIGQRDMPLETDARLMELSYGHWEGQITRQLMARYPAAFDAQTTEVLAGYYALAQGERFEAIQQRVGQFIADQVVNRPDEQIVVVAHGWTIKAFGLVALNASDAGTLPEPDNVSVSKLIVAPDTGRRYLAYYNRIVPDDTRSWLD